ncbi:MAG: cupredoxin domain-containing protein [Chloroflexia bacterium]|nr:cupredoxin domain-containing protein [Chloroflexia bacterium]
MGAVQKLATVVIVGLVALSTLLVIYLADEPNRMAAEVVEKDEVAIERGIDTFSQNCVVCHGPAGEGYSEPGAYGTGRIGAPLGGSTELGLAATALNQTEDEVVREERYDVITTTLQNGRGLMPAFGRGAEGGALLNDEQIHELALMIQNVDWDLVYNDVIASSGGYPTFPPPPAPAGGAAPTAAPEAAQNADAGAGENAGDAAASNQFTVESYDIYFEPKEIEVPSDTEITILLPNLGASLHNFSIDALDISVDIAPGATEEVTFTAPEGEYEYYCNVPGHKEAGMVGTLISRPMASADEPATANENAAEDEVEAAQQAAGETPAPATAQNVTSFDIYFEPKEITIPSDTDVPFTLPNDGAAAHNFSIDELGINVDIAAGATGETVINAPAGTYEYYCNIPGHKEAGMIGTLIVE